MRLVLVLLVLGWSAQALAQASSPEDEWQRLPNDPAGAPPQVPVQRTVPPPPLPGPALFGSTAPAPRYASRARVRVPELPNTVSMFGAPALGQWKRGEAFVLGFPFFQVRASIGLLDNLDVGVGYDSFYLLMHDLRLTAKYGFGKGPGLSFALALEGGVAFFNQQASRENKGARWLSGRRNFNVAPGLILSYQGSTARAARLFGDLRYLLAVDTEPFATAPLQGVPAKIIIGSNVLLKLGAELPLSERTSFLFTLGLEVHLRADDSPAMPTVAIGLVTGF